MLVELNIVPVGGSTHLSGPIAEAVKIIDGSGLAYQLTPTGTCIEGDWEAVMNVIRQCHQKMRETSSHVITSIRIEDDAGERNKLHRNVASVEEKIGRPLHQHEAGTHIYEARR